MTSTQAVISSASPTRTPANELLPVQQQQRQTDTKELLYQLPIQRKLSVGAADDPLEKEADDMADKVMRMPNPEPISFSTSKNVINRQCSECEKEEELQRKESNSEIASVAPPIVQDVLNCSGKSLDTDARSFMEPRFNYDFGNVKIHDNDIAAKSASSINALAYTSGNNVVFNSGQYNTNSDPGKRLLAHELTHVVQQNGSGIQRQEDITPVAPGNQAAKFIVADNMTPAAGQMRKSDFLERLNVEVCATVDETMQGTPFSSDNCPYVRAAFARHQNSSPIELEQVLERYEPSTRTAQSADDLIQRVKIRVASAASRWLQTGDLSDLPEEFRSQIPDGLGVVAGLFSSISSGIGSVVSGIGSVISGIGSLFFKANPGGAQPTQSPESVMQSLGKGNSMDGSTRVKMESAFGTSFSNVEVHTDNNAANLSSNMNARAFTVGNHVAFASGEHKPGTLVGDALMAHELAHVEQQKNAKQNDLHKKDELENRSLESEADNLAVGAILSSLDGAKGTLKDIGKRNSPRLRTGLQLQRCAASQKKLTAPANCVSIADDQWRSSLKLAIAMTDQNEKQAAMLTLVSKALCPLNITVASAGAKDNNKIDAEDYQPLPVVNFDINLNQKQSHPVGRDNRTRSLEPNAGYNFNEGKKLYAIVGPKALKPGGPANTQRVAEHEIYLAPSNLKGTDSDTAELDAWTQDLKKYFPKLGSIKKGPQGEPMYFGDSWEHILIYYGRVDDKEARTKSINELKAFFKSQGKDVQELINLWIARRDPNSEFIKDLKKAISQ